MGEGGEQEGKRNEEGKLETNNVVNIKRSGSFNPAVLQQRTVEEEDYERREGSLHELPEFSRKGMRSTVCVGDIKARSSAGGRGRRGGSPTEDTYTGYSVGSVTRSHSIRKPFQKIGDGLARTFRQL